MPNDKIDFVVAWVDGNDPEWIAERNKYNPNLPKVFNAQYREWGVFKYWFRAVEKNAPWVNKIHLVTCGHLPEWINTNHPKLNLVKHSDYIPEKYLPTFSANVIELNFHRIQNLEENFVYFNDDSFVLNKVKPTDFFMNGIPCDNAILSVVAPTEIEDRIFIHLLCNDWAIINKHFNKHETLKKNFSKWYSLKYKKLLLKNLYYFPIKKFIGFDNFHLPKSYNKNTYNEVWDLEPDFLNKVCYNKFRSSNDVNCYIMTYYNICKGDFIPRDVNIGASYTVGVHTKEIYKAMMGKKYKLLCINDNIGDFDFEIEKENLVNIFEKLFPEKCSFEK